MTASWQAGKTYVPGSLVKPLTTPPAVSAAPTNAGFETGDFTGWTASAEWSVVGGSQYAGSYCAELAAAAGDNLELVNTNQVPVTPGQVINGSLRVKQGAAGSGNAGALVRIHWYDASHAEIGHNDGDAVFNGGGSYKVAYLRAAAPSGAAFAAFGIAAWDHSPSHPMWVDDAAWDYTYAGPVAGLIYKAVQDAPGKSGSTEPDWPPVNGEQVVDNQVIWEAVLATRLVWQASPLMVSGATEPDWPEVNGGTVRDGSIDWIAQTTQILDVNCPHSKIVAIAAGKVYAADNDIIRYCATVNPLDWTSKDDAGYLPFGLQTYGSNPVAAMGLYRSNLVAFNSEGFQMWQVDEDPASTALLDALPIGSTQNLALAPVANDLFFMSSQGVRTVGIAAGSTNLQAGDVGMPVDTLIQQAAKQAATDGTFPISTYVPSQGQYWIAFSNFPRALSLSGDAPNGNDGLTYSYAYTASGGTSPYTFSISDGELPPGLSLGKNTGVITGTPTETGDFAFEVTVLDAENNSVPLPDGISIANATYAQIVMQQGPSAYWRFNEASGSVIGEERGLYRGIYQSTGITKGTTGLLAGDANKSVTGAGTGRVGDVATSLGVWSTEDISITCLVKPSSVATTQTIVQQPDPPNYGTSMKIASGGQFQVSFTSQIGGTGTVLSQQASGSPMSEGSTYHLAFTNKMLDSTHSKTTMFINGVSVFTTTDNDRRKTPVGEVSTVIGAFNLSGLSEFLNGVLDELSIFPRALSDDEVLEQYHASIGA